MLERVRRGLHRRSTPAVLTLRRVMRLGPLPDTLIIGAQKAGTTSLFHYLAEHPQVAAPILKEVHYFDNSYHRGESWYRAHFPPRAGRPVVFEASPYYLFHPAVPGRAATALPGAKLIVLMREPVARAYSHYQHERDLGHETLSFEEAVEREAERLGSSHDDLASGAVARSFEHQHFSYLGRGLYAEQVERWLRHFLPMTFLFLKAEDMFRSPQATYDRVCDFLGLDRIPIPNPAPRYQRKYPPIGDAVREALRLSFAEPNARLAELVGIEWP